MNKHFCMNSGALAEFASRTPAARDTASPAASRARCLKRRATLDRARDYEWKRQHGARAVPREQPCAVAQDNMQQTRGTVWCCRRAVASSFCANFGCSSGPTEQWSHRHHCCSRRQCPAQCWRPRDGCAAARLGRADHRLHLRRGAKSAARDKEQGVVAGEGQCLCREQAGPASGQLALRRLLSAPGRAPGCPKRRPASANQPRVSRWPAISGLHSTQASTLALFDKSTSITVCKSSNRQVRAALEPLGKLAEQLQTASVAESIRDKDFEACMPHTARTPD